MTFCSRKLLAEPEIAPLLAPNDSVPHDRIALSSKLTTVSNDEMPSP